MAALLALAPTAAWADGKGFRDGNDARGRLDIARVSHAHRGTRIVHTTRLRRPWPAKKLGAGAFALFYFDLRGRRGAGAERMVQVEFVKGRLVAHMFDTTTQPARHVGRVTLRRPDRRTVRVSFAKAMLRRGLRSYKWNAATLLRTSGGKCGGPGCIDWAPDGGKRIRHIRHVL